MNLMEDDSPYEIDIARVGGRISASDESLANAIRATLQRCAAPRARVSVALVDDPEIARLNEAHLHHAGPTDVLAFDLREDRSKADAAAEARHVDGEIVVSVETAAREAHARGHSQEAELMLYLVHGTLHLLGYDDRTGDDAARVHLLEDEILTGLGTGPVFGRPRR